MKRCVSFLLVAMFCLLLCSCGNESSQSGTPAPANTAATKEKWGHDKRLVGTWVGKEPTLWHGEWQDIEVTMEFKEDGTAYLTAEGYHFENTWKTSGDVLIVNTGNGTSRGTYTVNGNKLNVTYERGNTVTYTKQ